MEYEDIRKELDEIQVVSQFKEGDTPTIKEIMIEFNESEFWNKYKQWMFNHWKNGYLDNDATVDYFNKIGAEITIKNKRK